MKRRPSRSFLICLATLSALGTAGAWAWSRANSVPSHTRAKIGFFESVFYREKPANNYFPTPEDRARNRAATAALIEKLRNEYPALKIENHPVPEAENGFLQFYRFAQDLDAAKPPEAQELQRFLADDRWDTNEAKRLLSQNAATVARIEAIAALTQRSTANMPDDYHGFIEARPMKFAAEVLLLKARLAAEARDEPEAQRLTKAAFNLATHLRQVETPSLLGETVVLLLDRAIADSTFQHVLPALGREANLAQWKEILRPRSYTSGDFAHVMGGEWDNTTRHFLFPVLVDPSNRNRPKDADELAKTMTSHYHALITRMSRMSLAAMRTDPGLATPDELKNFSAKSREIYKTLTMGSASWSKGYLSAAVNMAQYQAALDLLIREKAGSPLTRDSAAEVSRDPLAEKPFDFDPVTRMLTTSSIREVSPLKLPL